MAAGLDSPASDSPYALIVPTELAVGTLQLRVWDLSHAGAVLAAAGDPDITCWNAVRLPDMGPGETVSGQEQARTWIEARQTWPGHCSWAVCDAVSGDVLGYASLHDLHHRHLSGEVGYWVLPRARGRGVARQAVRAVARFGFGALGLNRIELYHATDNPASCRVAQAAGFAVEGVARQAYRYGDGLLHDDHMHARLAADPDPG